MFRNQTGRTSLLAEKVIGRANRWSECSHGRIVETAFCVDTILVKQQELLAPDCQQKIIDALIAALTSKICDALEERVHLRHALFFQPAIAM